MPPSIDERLLHELKGRAEREHSFDRLRGRDLHFVVGDGVNVLSSGQPAKILRHVREGLVRLEEIPRLRIDQRDAARHVGEDLFVKDYFAFDSARRLALATGELAREPCADGGQDDQPDRREGDFVEKVADRFVGRSLRLLHYRHPPGRLDRAERIEVVMSIEMPGLRLTNLLDEGICDRRNRGRVRLEIVRKEGGAVLVDHLADRLVGKIGRAQTFPHPLHQDGDAQIADHRALGISDRTHDVRGHALVRQTRVDGGDVNRRSGCRLAPQVGGEFSGDFGFHGGNRGNEPAIRCRDEHAVDPRMRIEGLIQPFLRGNFRRSDR